MAGSEALPRAPSPPNPARRQSGRGQAAAAAPRRAAPRLRRGVHPDLRQRQPRPPPRRQAGPPRPRRVHWLRVRVAGPVPPRLLQCRHQAPSQLRRRRRRRLLPVERGRVREDARRAGLRVPRQRAGPRVAGADQRLRQRQHQRRPGGALRPALRPYRRLPSLLHPVDTGTNYILRGRDTDQGGGADSGHGRDVPIQAHVPLRHHLGRLPLGHAGRPVPRELQVRAVRSRVRRPRHTGLRRRPLRRVVRRGHGRRQRGAARGHGGVPARPHVLLLLPRPAAVRGAHVRVRRGGAPPRRGAPVRPRRDAAAAPAPSRRRPGRRHVIPGRAGIVTNLPD